MDAPRNCPDPVDANQRSGEPAAPSNGGELGEFSILLFRHAERLTRYIEGKIPAALRGVLSAEDIFQEVAIAAVGSSTGFHNRGPEAFWAWVKTIADHRLIDAIKTSRAIRRAGQNGAHRVAPVRASSIADYYQGFAAPGRSPSREVFAKEGVGALQIGMAMLLPEEREAIQRVELDGEPLDDVAARMGRTSDAVRSLIHRGHKKLQKFLGTASRFLSGSEAPER